MSTYHYTYQLNTVGDDQQRDRLDGDDQDGGDGVEGVVP